MNLKGFSGHITVSLGLAISLGACTTVDYRADAGPIEVIDSNFLESTNDSEIVLQDARIWVFSMVKALIRS